MELNTLVSAQLHKIADDLDSGNSIISKEHADLAMDLLMSSSDRNVKLSKYQSCQYLAKQLNIQKQRLHTAELAKRAGKVLSFELDDRLLPVLDETLAEFDNVEVINSDVLKVDLHKLIEEKFAGMKVAVCANLPYYITTPIITKLIEEKLEKRGKKKEKSRKIRKGKNILGKGLGKICIWIFSGCYVTYWRTFCW